MVAAARILIAHGERKPARELARVLGPVAAVDVAIGADEAARAVDAAPPAVVVIPDRLRLADGGEQVVAAARAAGARACVVVHEPDAVPVRRLFDLTWLHHLTTAVGPALVEELVVTVAKLVRGELFGADKYVSWSAVGGARTIGSTTERFDAVDELAALVDRLGLSRRDQTAIALAADELVANAIYNAPVDDAGRRYLRDAPRDAPRTLDAREAPELRWTYDGRWFAVAVRDHFGSLDAPTIVGHLRKSLERRGQIRADGAGAGIGVAMTYGAVRQLVYDLAPGRATEAIALVDVRPWPLAANPRIGSFHVFETPASGA